MLATYDGNGELKQRFEYTLGHAPTAFTQNGERYYLLTDQLGSPRIVTNSTGSVVKAIRYDSYGNVLEDSNPEFELPIGFAGGLYDVDTGLLRFGYRDFDPETGRWTARDPIGFAGGDTNLYGYVANNPISFIDPTGKIACGGVCIFAAGVVAGIVFDAAIAAISGSSSDASAVANGALGGATAANLPLQKKPRSGVAGGGPAGDKTSVASKLNHAAYQNGHISAKQRRMLTKFLRKFPYIGAGLSLAQLLNALYERFGEEAVDEMLNSVDEDEC